MPSLRGLCRAALSLAACCGSVPTARSSETFGFAITGAPGPYGERLSIDDKGITLQFPDDVAKLRIGGRFHGDFGAAATHQSGVPDQVPENFVVRRSWIESYLTLGKDLELAFQYDFANSAVPIKDAAVSWLGLPGTILTLGNVKEPFSLDQMNSSNATLFVERATADAFAPSRNFGFAVGGAGEDWTIVAGAFGGNANTGIESQGVAATARATYALVHTETRTLHLGLAGSYRSLPRDDNPLVLSSRSDTFLFQRTFISTGNISDAASIGRIGGELAYLDGPLTVQAEYIRTDIERFAGARPVSFQGGYVQVGFVVNGRRSYALTPDYGTTYAIVSGVQIADGQRVSQGGLGAFEFGLRFGAIDLDDGTVRGGIAQDVRIGVNWYPDNNVRLMANYVRSHASPSGIQAGRTVDADVFVGRLQLFW